MPDSEVRGLKRFLAMLLVLLAAFPALAGENGEAAGESSYLSWFYKDTAAMLSSPASGDGAYWGKAALTVVAAAAFYNSDEEIRERFSAKHSRRLDELAKAGELMGNGRFLLPAMGAVWAGGWAFESDYTTETVKLAFEAAVISAVGVQVVKLSTHRHRPFNEDGPYEWDGPDFANSSKDSFPSGHSAGAFSVAAVIANRYGTDNWWTAPLIYSVALITPLSRVYDDKHWASDAFAGAAIGYFTGKAIASYHPGGEGITFHPQLTEQGPMLAFTARF
ncbi:phosphatase PAP2 family protein [bacterium]|nr:MAG: phosphatase PAP2 family protein [bacterium]